MVLAAASRITAPARTQLPTPGACVVSASGAWLTPGLDSIAAVYFHRANDIARDYGVRRAIALAGIMAHEIGHLLLDRSAHSSTGVMRASWEYGDLLKIAQGTLWFTRPEAARIREMVRKRAESCGADLRR
jgi:hypothetical protein